MSSIAEILREAIRRTGRPLIEIERATGVPRDSISRFLADEQSLRLDSAEKIAEYFGLTVSPPEWLVRNPQQRVVEPGTNNLLQQIALAVNKTRPSLACPLTTGHFFTVMEIERSVKIEVLRRARGRATLIAIGLSFNSGSASQNRRQAERYLSFLKSQCPTFTIEWFPSPKTNCYLTATIPVPMGPESLPSFLNSCKETTLWFCDRPYADVKTM